MNIRTDLAMEAVEIYEKHEKKDFDGIEITTAEKDGVSISMMHIKDDAGAKKLDKKKGRYLTIEIPEDYFIKNPEAEESLAYITADCLLELTGDTKGKCILVVGLGNRAITADSIGPDTVDSILVTRHIKDLIEEEIGCVCATAPGVMGITGIETGEIVSGIAKNVSPDLVICVDALAAKSVDRVGRTIQMCDCGISPGAGVGNNRKALDEELLGVPVYVIGVPTVVDAYTLVCDMTGKDSMDFISDKTKNFSVAPKDVDFMIEQMSDIISKAINIALIGTEK